MLIKLIGVGLFAVILWNIDTASLWGYLSNGNLSLLFLSLIPFAANYLLKTIRWHILVRSTGREPTLFESWKLFSTGVFLGTITPGKIGELGRAVYLKKLGVPARSGIALVLLERLSDFLIIALLGCVGIGILFGWHWALLCLCLGMGAIIGVFLIKKRLIHLFKTLTLLTATLRKQVLLSVLTLTIVAWACYLLWAALLARSIGIDIPWPPLVAAITITGILSLLPIAPAGLGTRDAALIVLLSPFAVPPPLAVALAILMFTMNVLASGIGGLYWVQGKRHQ